MVCLRKPSNVMIFRLFLCLILRLRLRLRLDSLSLISVSRSSDITSVGLLEISVGEDDTEA